MMVLGTVSACPAAVAQPASAEALGALERRAADRALSAREREQAADRAVEVRRGLIAAAAESDPRLVMWLVDQGAALVARPSRDGSDSAVLLGLPLAGQIESVRRDAGEAAADLARARGLADAAALRQSVGEGAPAQAEVDRLANDRAVRIPFYRGRAEALLAGLGGAEGAGHAQAAVDALGKLALANPAPEAHRRVTLGAALLRRGGKGDAQDALEEFASVAAPEGRGGTGAGAASAQSLAEAWMGLVQAGAQLGTAEQAVARLHGAMGAAPFTADGKPDPLWTVLATDAAAAALTTQGVQTRQPALLEKAVAEESALLKREDLGFRAEALRPLVFEKLAVLATRAGGAGGAGGAGKELPAGMRLARAILAARDPARREEALAGLSAVAAAPDAGDFAADALWERAVLLTRGGTRAGRLEAARSLTRLARERTGHPRAQEAISAALAYARALEAEGETGARGAYLDALGVATTMYERTEGIDLWRYERARLLVEAHEPDRALDNLTTALDQLRRIGPESPRADDARRLFERAQVAQFDLLWGAISRARRTAQDGARVLARTTLRPAAEQAVGFARAHGSPFLDRFRADLADALVEAAVFGARDIYEDLLARDPPVPGGPARLHLGLGRALLIAGEREKAFRELQAAALALDAPPAESGAPARPEGFWHAWTLSLELLGEENKEGERSGTILAHVKRLRVTDPGLGGPPWKQRIEAVESRLSR